MSHIFTKRTLFIAGLFVFALAINPASVQAQKIQQTKKAERCQQDAKVCPDGTALPRIGPNCKFPPCPLPKEVMCTQDAKQCPDGRWVGRSGPNCTFDCSSSVKTPLPPGGGPMLPETK